MIKISVIVPAFNVEDYIEECLYSILHQSLKELEIIIVDDGSTDSTAEIIKRYERIYDRIKYIYQENKRIGAARNKGWEIAQGDYIYFMDSDDFIHPDWLKILYRNAKKNSLDITCGNYIKFLDKSISYEDIENISIDNKSYDIKIYETENFVNNPNFYEVYVWKYLYKKEFLDNLGFKFYEKYWYEDSEFSHKTIFSTDKIGYIDAKLLYHRIWKGSISQKNINKEILISSIALVEALNKFYNESLYYKYKKFFSQIIAIEMITTISYRCFLKKINGYENIDKKLKELIFHYRDSNKKKHRLLYVLLNISLPITTNFLYLRYRYYDRKRML